MASLQLCFLVICQAVRLSVCRATLPSGVLQRVGQSVTRSNLSNLSNLPGSHSFHSANLPASQLRSLRASVQPVRQLGSLRVLVCLSLCLIAIQSVKKFSQHTQTVNQTVAGPIGQLVRFLEMGRREITDFTNLHASGNLQAIGILQAQFLAELAPFALGQFRTLCDASVRGLLLPLHLQGSINLSILLQEASAKT